MNKICVIELYPPWTNCTLCNKDTLLKYFLPMYEGNIVNTKKSDDWAGMPVCKECHIKWSIIK